MKCSTCTGALRQAQAQFFPPAVLEEIDLDLPLLALSRPARIPQLSFKVEVNRVGRVSPNRENP